MKPNPKNFEAFIDPDGGEWIKMKSGKYKDIVWRPTDVKMDEENADGSGNLSFEAEFLGPQPEDFDTFEKIAGQVIVDILSGYVNENSDSNSSKN